MHLNVHSIKKQSILCCSHLEISPDCRCCNVTSEQSRKVKMEEIDLICAEMGELICHALLIVML